MGMCKGCSQVFNVTKMKDGYCEECLPQAEIEKAKKTENITSGSSEYDDAMLEAFVAKPEKLYWYKKSFEKFNVNGIPVMKWNWSWWAFFGGWAFLMYRKQYMAAFILFIIEVVTQLIYLGLIPVILSGGFATYFVYKGYRTKVGEIESVVEDNSKRIDTMKHVGGYNSWAILAKIIGSILQILLVIAIYASFFAFDFNSLFSNQSNDPYYEEVTQEINDIYTKSSSGFQNGKSYNCENMYIEISSDASYIMFGGFKYNNLPFNPTLYYSDGGYTATINRGEKSFVIVKPDGSSFSEYCN